MLTNKATIDVIPYEAKYHLACKKVNWIDQSLHQIIKRGDERFRVTFYGTKRHAEAKKRSLFTCQCK